MKRPQAVVFDLGKVLLEFDFRIAIRRLLSRCTLSALELGRLIDQSPLLLRYEAGEITSEAFFNEVKSASGFQGDFPEFNAMFCDIFTPIEAMVQRHARLRAQGMPTYVFSNTNAMATQHIRRHFPFFSSFDGYILSFEHGTLKPDARLYAVVERCTGRGGPELLYLDDRPENVAAGAVRGWQTIRHESPEKTGAIFRQLGLD